MKLSCLSLALGAILSLSSMVALAADESEDESGDDADQQEEGSAEWIWQKIQGQIQEQLNNAVADAVGEGEKASPDVDPFDFKGLEF